LSKQYGVVAAHALYHKEGTWYHHLDRFPGALFDADGYVVFQTLAEFKGCPQLRLAQDVHCESGISSIAGYVRLNKRATTRP
jgi:5-methylcytosine-specific restriction protein A